MVVAEDEQVVDVVCLVVLDGLDVVTLERFVVLRVGDLAPSVCAFLGFRALGRVSPAIDVWFVPSARRSSGPVAFGLSQVWRVRTLVYAA
jgi:hypothetical protein